MAFQKVGSLSELPPGSLSEIEISGRQIALCNVDGAVHAIDGVCPHRGAPLAQGALQGKMVVCPWHAWEFDCTTGVHDYNPAICQEKFAVRVDGDDILVDIA